MYKSHKILKEILVFIKRHVVICILLLVSLFVIAKYSQIPSPNWLWVPITKLLLRPSEGTVAYEWLGIFNNISLAYFASIITYLVIQYIPERKKAYSAFDVLKKELVSIYSIMSHLISMYLFELGIEKSEDQITVNDLSDICNIKITDSIKHCKIQHIKSGEKENVCEFDYNLYNDSKKYFELLQKSIKHIKEAPCCEHLDLDIIGTVSKIENNWFTRFFLFSCQYFFRPTAKTPGSMPVIWNLDKGFYEFITCHLSLKKYNFDLFSYEFLKMSNEEIKVERENHLFVAPRFIYEYTGVSKAENIANNIIALEPTEERIRKSVGVLLEMLVYYDYSGQNQTEILKYALSIAEYIVRNETDESEIDTAILNYLQVKKRLNNLSPDDIDALQIILSKETAKDVVRCGAAILIGDYQSALESFGKLSDEEKDLFIQFPIYLLWPNPPIKANPNPMIFVLL